MAIREDTYEQTMQSIRDNVAEELKKNWHIVGNGLPATREHVYAKVKDLMSRSSDTGYVGPTGQPVDSSDPNAIPTNATAHEIAERTSTSVASNAPDFRENFWGALMTYLAAAFTWLVENVSAMFGGNDGKPARSFSQIVADSVTPKMQEAVGQSLGEMAADPKHKAFFERTNLVEKAKTQIADGVATQAGLKEAEPAFNIDRVEEGKAPPAPAITVDTTKSKDEQTRQVLEQLADSILKTPGMNTSEAEAAAIKKHLVDAGAEVAQDGNAIKDPNAYVKAVLDKALPKMEADSAIKNSKTLKLLKENRAMVEPMLVDIITKSPAAGGKSAHAQLLAIAEVTLSPEDQKKTEALNAANAEKQRQAIAATVYKTAYDQTLESMDRQIAKGLVEAKQYTPPAGTNLDTIPIEELRRDKGFQTALETARGYGRVPTEAQRIAIAHMVGLGTRDAVTDESNANKNPAEMAEAVATSVRRRLSRDDATAINKNINETAVALPELNLLGINTPDYKMLTSGKGLGVAPAGGVSNWFRGFAGAEILSFKLNDSQQLAGETAPRTWTDRITAGAKEAMSSEKTSQDITTARDTYHNAGGKTTAKADTKPAQDSGTEEKVSYSANPQFDELVQRAGSIPVDRSGHPSGLSGDVRREQPRGVDAPSVA